MYKVTSEIHTEGENVVDDSEKNHVTREFSFVYPPFLSEVKNETLKCDEDGDLIVNRPKKGSIVIEYSTSTELQLVGLQIWRGALLLADYVLSHPYLFKHKKILELGSGVGLTSIVASLLANEVICTDVNVGGILELIGSNFERNESIVRSKFVITELNFFDSDWSPQLQEKLKGATVILAADVIYDDDVTDGFVATLSKLFDENPSRIAYVALEKRYVFTIANLDSVAPMYEEFLRCIDRRKFNWTIEYIDLEFPQYFQYDRVKQMILMKIHPKKDSVT
ncbi:methyltransferase-like protein 22 [Venturia canescens]|uniref:methyltransferase-like protein 22 n=1 Tax=Venturia canescens TaxID=32260 RepID=UPI001C9C6578|nr:methyltransferase-like protein 22 [Venturia canescens]XP_043284282.1 methyltransferase-like protein 22 [Venturia canescens]